jgi:hypothetical protein
MSRKWNVISRIVKDADGVAFCPECGTCLEDERSLAHLRMFHAFVAHCFENWPEDADFLPDNREHLRAWLLVKAKHREPHHIFSFANRREMQLGMMLLEEEMRADRARGAYGWVVPLNHADLETAEKAGKGAGLIILRAASISIHGAKPISEKKFVAVSDAVFKVAYDYAKIDFDAWKNGSEFRNYGGEKAS